MRIQALFVDHNSISKFETATTPVGVEDNLSIARLVNNQLVQLGLLGGHSGVGPSVELRPALEAVVGLRSRQQRVAVHAHHLLRNNVFLLFVETLAREERILVDVLSYLAQYFFSELLN